MRLLRDRLVWAALAYSSVTTAALIVLTRALGGSWSQAVVVGAVGFVAMAPVILLLLRMATVSRQVTRTAAHTHALVGRLGARLEAHYEAAAKEFSRLVFHVEKVPAIAGTVSRTRTELGSLIAASQPSAERPATPDARVPIGLFDPSVIPSTPVARVTADQVPGRQSAATKTDPDLPRKLALLITPPTSPRANPPDRRAVAVVAGQGVRTALAADFDVTPIHPSIGVTQLESAGFSSLVIEERALACGPWAGALDAAGTLLYQQLQEIALTAKTCGATVLVLASDAPTTTFSTELRRLADVVTSSDGYELPWGSDLELPVLRALGFRSVERAAG